MVKVYLRYVLKETFGVIASPACNSIFLDPQCRLAAAGALEHIAVWNLKQGLLVQKWGDAHGDAAAGQKAPAPVTCLCASPDGRHIATGYEDGSVKVWDRDTATLVLTLNGHRSAVTALHYNAGGTLLVSGARDTDLIGTTINGLSSHGHFSVPPPCAPLLF